MPKVLNGNLDALKVVLAICVVALHCKVFGGNDTAIGYMLGNGLFRVAVPVFFIINGYYLFHTLSEGHSFGAWFKRGLWMYLFWMLVYSPFYVDPATVGTLRGLLGIVKSFLIGYFHLWYLVGMLGGGLVLYAPRHWRTPQLVTLALIAYLIGLALQYARVYYVLPDPFLQHFNQNDYAARNFLFMGFPFMCMGFVFAKHQVAQAVSRPLVWGWLVMGVALMLAESYMNYSLRANPQLYFDFMFSLPILTPALFLLARVYFRASSSNTAAKVSSAVYYIHPLFILGALTAGMAYGNVLALVVIGLALAVAPGLIALSKRLKFVL